MPVDGGRLRKMVLENNSYAIALIDLDRRPWARAVVTPDFHVASGHQPAFDGRGNQVKFLDAAIHPPRKLRHIGSLNRKRMGHRSARMRARHTFVRAMLH